MRKYRHWLLVGIPIVLVIVGAFYFLVLAPRVITSESDRRAAEAEAKFRAREDARRKVKASLPGPLTLEEAKQQYEDFVKSYAESQKKIAAEAKELQAKFDSDPSDGDTAHSLVRDYWRLSRNDDAKRVAERWTKAAPEDVESWKLLGQCCLWAAAKDEAEAAWTKVEAMTGQECFWRCVDRSQQALWDLDFMSAIEHARRARAVATTDSERAKAIRMTAEAHINFQQYYGVGADVRYKHALAGYEAAKESLKYEDTVWGHLQVYTAARACDEWLRGHPDWRKRDAERLPKIGEQEEHLQKAGEGWPFYVGCWDVAWRRRDERGDKYGAWARAKFAHYLAPTDPKRLARFAIMAEKAGVEPDATEACELLGRVLAGTAKGEWDKLSDWSLYTIALDAAKHDGYGRAAAPRVVCTLYPSARKRIRDYSWAMIQMSNALREAGRGKDALEAAQFAIVNREMMTEFKLGTLMLCYAATAAASAGDLELADLYVSMSREFPDSTEGDYSDLALNIVLYGGDYDWALRQVETALRASPGNRRYLDCKACVLYKKGDYAAAQELCDQLSNSSYYGFAIGYIGLKHAADGDRAKALECLRKVCIPEGVDMREIPRELRQMREQLEAEVGAS